MILLVDHMESESSVIQYVIKSSVKNNQYYFSQKFVMGLRNLRETLAPKAMASARSELVISQLMLFADTAAQAPNHVKIRLLWILGLSI